MRARARAELACATRRRDLAGRTSSFEQPSSRTWAATHKSTRASPVALSPAALPWHRSRASPLPSQAQDRLRSIGDNQRILGGVEKWPMDRLQHRGIMCYERALGRMTTEHKEWKGKPTVRYMTSLVHTKPLPTAIGSASDHYLVVSPGGGIRWASVQELARSMEVPEGGVLWHGLSCPRISTIQMGEAIGRGVHTGVARSLLRHDRGSHQPDARMVAKYHTPPLPLR